MTVLSCFMFLLSCLNATFDCCRLLPHPKRMRKIKSCARSRSSVEGLVHDLSLTACSLYFEFLFVQRDGPQNCNKLKKFVLHSFAVGRSYDRRTCPKLNFASCSGNLPILHFRNIASHHFNVHRARTSCGKPCSWRHLACPRDVRCEIAIRASTSAYCAQRQWISICQDGQ